MTIFNNISCVDVCILLVTKPNSIKQLIVNRETYFNLNTDLNSEIDL